MHAPHSLIGAARNMLLFWVFLAAAVAADSASLGCYSSVDTSNYIGYGTYETLSLCASSCGDSYPYVAIKDGGYCYCLLLLPTDSTSSSNCNVKCNGYGTVMCGGTDAYSVFEGLGTASSSSAAASSSAQTSSSTSSSEPSSTSASSSSSTSSASAAALTTSSALSTGGTTVITTLALSENGSVVYKTVTQTLDPTASASASASATASSKKSTSVGPIVGGVVGGLTAVALLGVGVFFFLRHRSLDGDDDEEEFYEKPGVARGLSKSGLKKYNSAFDMPMANPFTHPSDEFADKRASRMTENGLTDPRLNPALMGRRRLLEGSLADEADYLRKLGVANP